jgi:hypothetical protein
MSTTIKITGWLLMTVMHSGVVNTAQFPTEALCKDGESLATYGKTVAEKNHDDMVARIAAQVDQALWDLNNPRHEPATDDEWKLVRKARGQPDVIPANQMSNGVDFHNTWPRDVWTDGYKESWIVFEDGTIQKQQGGAGATGSGTVMGTFLTDWVTATRCVPIPDETSKE